ncbi:armadillo-type protein [Trichoderma sp. SZMC 28014]
MMNKFNSPEDPDYQENPQNIRTNSPLDDADAWIRNKHYAVDQLKIERLSGDLLPIDQCYINLAVVEQGSDEPETGAEKSSPFSIFNRQKIKTPDTTIQVELATIFNQRQNRNGEMIQPRRILIRGCAGVGKTTLCKKIVHGFTQGTWGGWNDLFDRILWIPLRNLKLEERRQHWAYDFEALLIDEYFFSPNKKPDLAKHLAQALESSSSSRTLFLLDGLDEVSQDLTGSSSMSRFLDGLLEQPNILVTSRPSGRLPPKLDLELEVVGFYPDQVKNYIEKTFTDPKTKKINKKTVNKIQSFLHNHRLIQGLVRIPIQLDALCYSWKDIRSKMPETMTAHYQAIELSLWKKDIVRLEKKLNDRLVTPCQIQDDSRRRIEEFVQDEISFLESLAFAGLCSDILEFEPEHLDSISDRFSGFLVDRVVSSLSFLRASNPSSEYPSYHFIHLTFQEYFAARYFVRQWTAREHLSIVELGSEKVNEIEPARFFQKHKYKARYDVLWRFVAGLLDAEPEEISLFFQSIESQPLDLLGPAHQRLAMHCLSEVTSNIQIRTDIEQRLSKWLLFECDIMHLPHSYLATEVEFPERALDTAIREASDEVKKVILRSFTNSNRTTTPESILEQAISWLGHADYDYREAAIAFLQRKALPTNILGIVAAKLEEENENLRESAVKILGKQSILPTEIVEAITARLEDKNWAVRLATVEALGERLDLPDEILKALVASLEDWHQDIRNAAVKALGQRPGLSVEILEALAARLEYEHRDVGTAAVHALGQRSNLPGASREALAARLTDKPQDVRKAAVEALGQQPGLPNKILKALAARLEDEYCNVRKAAVEALGQQPGLSVEILEALVARLEDEYYNVRKAAVEALGQRPGLSIEILETLAARLEDKRNDIRNAAVGALGQRPGLSVEILEALAARLRDSFFWIRIAAAEVLDQQLDQLLDQQLDQQLVLSNKILQAIAVQLEDENWKVRQTAWKVLTRKRPGQPYGKIEEMAKQFEIKNWLVLQVAFGDLDQHISLSGEPLKAIVAQLEDDEASDAQLIVALKALGTKSDLPSHIVQAIAAQFQNNKPKPVQLAAAEALRSQSDLSSEIPCLYALAALVNPAKVDDFDKYGIKESALKTLGNHSNLPNDILDAIAARLKDKRPNIRASAIMALDSQLTLPTKYLHDIAPLLNDNPGIVELVISTLRKRKEFYPMLLEGPYAPSFYKELLLRSFMEDFSWCIDDDGSSFISMPGDGGGFVFDKQYDMNAIVEKILPANYTYRAI